MFRKALLIVLVGGVGSLGAVPVKVNKLNKKKSTVQANGKKPINQKPKKKTYKPPLVKQPRIIKKHIPNKPQKKLPMKDIFAVTIPKSGTHMMAKCLRHLTGRDIINVSEFTDVGAAALPRNQHHEIYRGHIRHTPQAGEFFSNNKFKGLLMMRDPRDQLVSMTYWIVLRPEAHPEEAARYKADPSYFNEVLMERIKGIKDYYQPFLPWLSHPRFYTVRFENLVGARGGGKQSLQFKELYNIAKHLNVSRRVDKLKRCSKSLFGGTATFRKGQIGSWKRHFKPEHKEKFKEIAGQLLIDLGYEANLDW